jgi:methionyl-tRNA synthetase
MHRFRRTSAELTLITSPPPTPNGPLHVGHLSGPYLAADVAARAARLRGEAVLVLSGLDVHQNYVVTKAAADERPVADTLRAYGDLIRAGLTRARIGYDVFLDPTDDPAYRDSVAGLLADLVAAKAALVEDTDLLACAGCGRTLHHGYVTGGCPHCGAGSGGGTCERCGGFTTAATLVGARCACCGGEPTPRRVPVPVLRLEDYRDRLLDVWARAELTPRVRDLVEHYLDTGLPDVPLAYPTDWGIPSLGGRGAESTSDGQRVDVWAEMGLGYLYAVAREIDPGVRSMDGCVAAWDRIAGIWHFLGIDNAFYYAVLIPALFLAAGLPPGLLRGLEVNEFYRLDGQKFSTSRNHAVWAHEFLDGEDPGLVRLYLCWDRPEPYESDFTVAGYREFRERFAAAVDGPAGGGCAGRLAESDAARAEHALRLPGFDPALAARCLLSDAGRSDRGRALLGTLLGTGPD